MGCRLWGRTESDTTEVTQQQQQQKAVDRCGWCQAKIEGGSAQLVKNPTAMQETRI